MIHYWLHTEPVEELEEWNRQFGQAKWLEERYFTALARVIHGNKRG